MGEDVDTAVAAGNQKLQDTKVAVERWKVVKGGDVKLRNINRK